METLSRDVPMACRLGTLEISRGITPAASVLSTMNPLPALCRVHEGFCSRFRNVWFRALGVRLKGYVWLRHISIPRNWSDITIIGPASLDDGVVMLSIGRAKENRLLIREGTYINRHTMFDASEGIEVGRNCMIGPFCYITDHDHAHAPGALISGQPLVGKPIHIGEDVWIGAGVIILKGVTIGDGAVIGAGAVVTRNVAPGAKVAGLPARHIGHRGGSR